LFPLLLERERQTFDVVLLARRLKAACPDALRPGKARDKSPGESELSPWDFPGFLGPEATNFSYPQRDRRM